MAEAQGIRPSLSAPACATAHRTRATWREPIRPHLEAFLRVAQGECMSIAGLTAPAVEQAGAWIT